MSQELANLLVEENTRLRAEVRDLKARLSEAKRALFGTAADATTLDLYHRRLFAMLDLRRTNWRKP